MFGGVAAKVNGHIFAGLFGRSTMVWLPEADRAEALALEGAAWFDPMGNGRVHGDKIMLPERMMEEPEELRHWLARAFEGAASLPAKAAKAPARKGPKATPPNERPVKKSPAAKRTAASPAKATTSAAPRKAEKASAQKTRPTAKTTASKKRPK
jgi:hypothetical protein